MGEREVGRFPFGIDPERWEALKDEHALHPDPPRAWWGHSRTPDLEDETEEEPNDEKLDDERFDRLIDVREATGQTARSRTPGRDTLERAKAGIAVDMGHLSKRDREAAARLSVLENGPDDGKRRLPLTRAGCADVPRPCPHVGCHHNLFLDVTNAGSILMNYPEREPGDLDHRFSCSLDVAERGAVTLEEIGVLLQLSRERIRQVEDRCLEKLQIRIKKLGYSFEDLSFEHVDASPVPDDMHLGGISRMVRASPMGRSTFKAPQLSAQGMKNRMAHAREVRRKNLEKRRERNEKREGVASESSSNAGAKPRELGARRRGSSEARGRVRSSPS